MLQTEEKKNPRAKNATIQAGGTTVVSVVLSFFTLTFLTTESNLVAAVKTQPDFTRSPFIVFFCLTLPDPDILDNLSAAVVRGA